MVRTRSELKATKSQTLPSSPSHSFSSSSSSSDFEFTVSVSPRKASTALCPADELFYKGQLLPLHLSPRLSMVRTLLLASSSISSSSGGDTTTTASRDSTGSSTDSHSSFSTTDLVFLADGNESSRPSSVADLDDEFKKLNTNNTNYYQNVAQSMNPNHHHHQIKKNKYFSLSRFSSVFRKDPKMAKETEHQNASGSSVKRMSNSAKEVIKKYLKIVKPFYEKLSQQKQQQQQQQQQQIKREIIPTASKTVFSLSSKTERSVNCGMQSPWKGSNNHNNGIVSHSFSGNLRYPRRKSCVSSCPSSMRSSPSHSGVLSRSGFTGSAGRVGAGGGMGAHTDSSMEELQSAIQGAIAHCKNSMLQNKSMVSNEI